LVGGQQKRREKFEGALCLWGGQEKGSEWCWNGGGEKGPKRSKSNLIEEGTPPLSAVGRLTKRKNAGKGSKRGYREVEKVRHFRLSWKKRGGNCLGAGILPWWGMTGKRKGPQGLVKQAPWRERDNKKKLEN